MGEIAVNGSQGSSKWAATKLQVVITRVRGNGVVYVACRSVHVEKKKKTEEKMSKSEPKGLHRIDEALFFRSICFSSQMMDFFLHFWSMIFRAPVRRISRLCIKTIQITEGLWRHRVNEKKKIRNCDLEFWGSENSMTSLRVKWEIKLYKGFLHHFKSRFYGTILFYRWKN